MLFGGILETPVNRCSFSRRLQIQRLSGITVIQGPLLGLEKVSSDWKCPGKGSNRYAGYTVEPGYRAILGTVDSTL